MAAMGHEGTGITRWGKVHAWWLRHPAIEADHFCVLSALSTYADESGLCEPSQATLARWLKRSRPWVNRVIGELVEAGLLEKEARTRTNGGTTSCRYRVLSVAPEAGQAPVGPVTAPVADGDTPRQSADMNQADPEQNQPARSARATALESGFAAQAAAPQPIQATWQPSDAAVSRALGLYPDADIAEHTALFVSRCRAKGYPVRAGGEDDMWLSWLIDDRRTAGSPSGRAAARGGAPSVPAGTHRRFQDARFERFAAWSLAADRGSAVPRQA